MRMKLFQHSKLIEQYLAYTKAQSILIVTLKL